MILIIKNLNLISVQSWTYLVFVAKMFRNLSPSFLDFHSK